MKILVVCQYFYPEQFRINDICKELVKRGHEVTVLTGLPNYPKGKVYDEYKRRRNRRECIEGVKIIRCSLVGRGNNPASMLFNYIWFAVSASLITKKIKGDFDLIYTYQLSPITMVRPAIKLKKEKNIPLVLHCLDLWPISIATGGVKQKSILYKIISQYSKKMYNGADIITCSSLPFKNYFMDELHISEKKGFFYLPSYAENDYLSVKTIDNGTFDLLFAGNIGPHLSVETIVEAANILKDKDYIRFHIVGDGLSKKQCEGMAHKYGLNNIVFYGQHTVEEMRQYYELADAFLITMVDNEVVNSTLPAKVQSYMAAGKPILGAISGEAERVIKEANCGLCCENCDAVGLAEIILEASCSQLMNEWSENAYTYYLKNFNKDRCMDALEEVLKSTLEAK